MHRYMKEIYRAHENGMPVVGPTYLARAIGVSKSTAHHMLKNMERMGYGRYIERKGFVLNERGMEEARKIMRKHRLLESFLATIFSLSPEKACMEAGKKFKIVNRKKVLPYAPRVWKICLDVKVYE